MKKLRAALFSLCAVPAAFASTDVAPPPAPAPVAHPVELIWRVTKVASTPLEQIPLYSLDPGSPLAMRSLDAELDRLYRHALTLPSGPERRAFEGRIHRLEKQFRPLLKTYDADEWLALRLAVKNEWLDVQSGLVAVAPAPAAPPAIP